MAKTETCLDIRETLAPGGPVSKLLPSFEMRPEQVKMACAIQRALVHGRHLAVEAGTGVGKSIAYLIPAIDLACREGSRALISTFTITLQEQLVNKDIPLLSKCLPHKFTAVLAKGRGNYLCKRRLNFTLQRQRELFDESAAELQAICEWAERTEDGSLTSLPFLPGGRLWDKIRSEHGNCRGRKCPGFRDCFYWRARRRLETANIIVVNHALLFSDLVLKQEDVKLLPDYQYVIIDEAHNVEHVAEEHFGLDITNRRVRYLLDGLYNTRTRKGLLAYMDAEKAIDAVAEVDRQAGVFFNHVRDWYDGAKDQTNGRCHRNFVEDTLSGHLKSLRTELSGLAKTRQDEDEKFEIARFTDLCESLVQDLGGFMLQEQADSVYWVETGGEGKTVRLRGAPVDVGPDVKRCLFDNYDSVILTSATLSTGHAGGEGAFDFFAARIGLEDFDALKLGSPFDYQKQVTMYIEKNLPNPNEVGFAAAASEALKRYILKTAGRAFVLFTSYSMLDELAGALAPWLAENGIELLCQGSDVDRTTLLKRFKADGKSVLFGADSFWQGVDVPGEALSNVIIVRLPFAVPDQPLLGGRLERIREQGGNPFFDYQLPSAIIKFKQGFGRLIRSKTDTGIVVILDSRIINKPYGRQFLAAIPRCKIEIVPAKK